jgi:hypothetical protein
MPIPINDLQPGVHDPVVLLVSRLSIESCDIAPVLNGLRLLSATCEDAWLYREQLAIVFDGYEDDPHELVDLPEIRNFVRKLDVVWPYWAFFMNQLDSTISLWLACLCGRAYPGAGQVEIDVETLVTVLKNGFDGMNLLFEKHQFPEAVLQTQSEGIQRVVAEMGIGE